MSATQERREPEPRPSQCVLCGRHGADELFQLLRDCDVVMELRKLGRFTSADKLEAILNENGDTHEQR